MLGGTDASWNWETKAFGWQSIGTVRNVQKAKYQALIYISIIKSTKTTGRLHE